MKNKMLFGLRIFFIILAVMGSFLSDGLKEYGLIFFLLMQILGQLRFFSLDNRKWILATLVIDLVLLFFILKGFQGYSLGILGLVSMDIGLFAKKREFIVFLLGILTVVLVSFLGSELEEMFFYVTFTIINSVVFHIMEIETDRKKEAQFLYDKLRLTEDQLMEANEELKDYALSIEEITVLRERNRIAREVHDSAGHALTTLNIQLGALEKVTGDKNILPMINELKSFTKTSLDEVRRSVHALQPEEYSALDGLVQIDRLIQQYKKMTNRTIMYQFSRKRWLFSEDQSSVLYRAVQEFLSNVDKHSKATVIQIILIYELDQVVLTMKDNGPKVTFLEGMGLKSMRERVSEIGGRINIESTETGFEIQLILPKKDGPFIGRKK